MIHKVKSIRYDPMRLFTRSQSHICPAYILTNRAQSKISERYAHTILVSAEKAMPATVREERVDMMTETRTIPLQQQNQHFVLVHGIGGGSWCWYKIQCLMENSGYKVSCIDLKSAGIDRSDADSVVSFDDYNQPLMDFMSSLPQNEQVILVGHSAGGLSITQACHKFSKKIRLAVYLAATMLKLGFQTEEDIKDGIPDLSEFGDVYELGFGLGNDKPPTSAVVKKEFQRKIIYHLSPHEDSTLAAMLLKPGPVQALTSARFDEEGEVEKVRRVYIRTKQDKVVKGEQQESMIKKWPPCAVYELDSDHSPFFSTPFVLFGLLVKAVAAFDVGFNFLSQRQS